MVPWAHVSPRPKWHLDWLSWFCMAHDATNQPTADTNTPCYCNSRPHLHSSEMQPKNELCSVLVKDGTNQSHNINEIYNVCLYQATNFLNAPCIYSITNSFLSFCHYSHVDDLTRELYYFTNHSFDPIANLKGPYFQLSLSACLSVCVCVCVSLTGTSTLQR